MVFIFKSVKDVVVIREECFIPNMRLQVCGIEGCICTVAGFKCHCVSHENRGFGETMCLNLSADCGKHLFTTFHINYCKLPSFFD